MSEIEETTKKFNPLLTKIRVPGKRVRLPSMGILYQNGELAENVTNGEIEIFPLSTYDEIMLNSPDSMLSGDAIIDVFSRCVPDILKPLECFVLDLDYVMTVIHNISTADHYNVGYTHSCEDANDHEYKVACEPIISRSVFLDPTSIDSKFNIDTSWGQKVQLEPVRLKYRMKINKTINDSESTMVEYRLNMLSTLINNIKTVDDISDKDMITEWFTTLSNMQITEITAKISNVNDFGPKMKADIQCKDCGEEFSIDIEVNPLNFFLG